ncbi:MAG: hypothetical protein E8D41_00490 [Nitrospira sp.]|nr:MAG: hypothetical protein E8D41_00490 [Nitrospira sp.]
MLSAWGSVTIPMATCTPNTLGSDPSWTSQPRFRMGRAWLGLALLVCTICSTVYAQEPLPQPPEELPVPQPPITNEQPQPGPREPQPLVTPASPQAAPIGAEPERPKSQKPIDQLLLQRGAILLPPGWLQVEPSFDYLKFSTDRLNINGLSLFEAIVIGEIRADKVTREVATAAINLRYGLMNRLQIEARIPYVYRHDRELLAVGTQNEAERNVDNQALGDVEGSLVWQAYLGSDSSPAVLLRLRGRSRTGKDPFTIPVEQIPVQGAQGQVRSQLTDVPTGNGYWSVAPGFTMVWRTDPVVLFAGANYSINLERTIGGLGRLEPGDNWDIFLGLNFAVSEKLGINMTAVDSNFATTRVNGVKQPNTAFNSGVLSIGTSIVLSSTRTLLISVGKGLTEESPDFQFSISLPLTFHVF